MQVTHAGYNDPNNLNFDDITILGVPHSQSVSVTHGDSVTVVPNANIEYNGAKQVNKHTRS